MASPRPKILLTLHMFSQGGTDRVCAHLARGFADAGFDTEVLVFCRGGSAEAVLLPEIGKDVRVVYLGPRVGGRAADLRHYFLSYVRHLRRVRPDCVISTSNNMNWTTALGLKLSGLKDCRLVLKTTNPILRPKDGFAARIYRRLRYALAFRAADRILTLSDAETRQLRALFPASAERFSTVVNPYVTPAMLAYRGQKADCGEGRLVLAVGRLEPQKRLDLLIRAFAKVTTPRARLILLGEGRSRAMLEALVRALGLEGRVEMPGFVPDVRPWFARADLFVLPSVYEGLPAVVLEAMAANCPVLSTDCFPAAREIVGAAERCAVIARPDPALLATMIDRSLSAPRPTALRAIAAAYSIQKARRSHVTQISELLGLSAAGAPDERKILAEAG